MAEPGDPMRAMVATWHRANRQHRAARLVAESRQANDGAAEDTVSGGGEKDGRGATGKAI
eukprot:14647523-Alexandrium_andersonii.AAC.1